MELYCLYILMSDLFTINTFGIPKCALLSAFHDPINLELHLCTVCMHMHTATRQQLVCAALSANQRPLKAESNPPIAAARHPERHKYDTCFCRPRFTTPSQDPCSASLTPSAFLHWPRPFQGSRYRRVN